MGIEKMADKLGIDKLRIDPASLSRLNVFANLDNRFGRNSDAQKLRRGISLPDLKESNGSNTSQPPLQHKPSASANFERESVRQGQELVSSHSERSLFHSPMGSDEFRRRAPSTSHTGIQPDFVNIRASSPSYTDKQSTPNMNPVTTMTEINEMMNGQHGMDDMDPNDVENGQSAQSNRLSNGQSSGYRANDNHALEIEMTMDDDDENEDAPLESPLDRTSTDPDRDQPFETNGHNEIDKQNTV